MNVRNKIKHTDRLRLKGKTILYGIIMIIFIVSIFTSHFIWTEKNIFHNELKNRATSLVKNLSYNCEYPVLVEDLSAIRQLASGVMNDEDVSSIEIRNTAGKILFPPVEKETIQQKSLRTGDQKERE